MAFLSVCAVNAWRLKMKVSGEKEPYLEFLRELVIEMFIVHGKVPLRIREHAVHLVRWQILVDHRE